MGYLTKEFLVEIYFTLVLPAVFCAITVCSNSSGKLIKQLEKFIRQLPTGMSKNQGRKELRWDSITFMYKKRIALMMHKLYSDEVAPPLAKLFQREECIYLLRKRKQMTLLRKRSEKGQRCLAFRVPKI